MPPSTDGAGGAIGRADLEAILDSLAEGIVTLSADRRVVGINRAACEILEVDRGAALGAACSSLLGEHFCTQAARVNDSLQAGRPIDNVLAKLQGGVGRDKVLNFRTSMFHDAQRQLRGSVVIFRDVTEIVELKEDLARRYRLHNVVGKSKPMQEIFRLVEEVADSDATVLLQGESGTGKELVARAIHQLSPRREGPFVAVNCSALAEGVLESELFGHVRGAFTGATSDKRGRFEAAAGGTIFLDEIGDLAPAIQVKLLRVLQERTIERVGSDEPLAVDMRVIAATHRPLSEMIAAGTFRQDLYYRLRVVPIDIPPLRQRRDDVPLLAAHFVEKFRGETGRAIDGLSPDALALLLDYPWPGNVRELENAMEYAFVKARSGPIEPPHLPPEIGSSRIDLGATSAARSGTATTAAAVPHLVGAATPAGMAPPAAHLHDGPAMAAIPPSAAAALEPAEVLSDAETLRRVLDATGWNVSKVARRLRVSRTTLYERIANYGLQRPRD